MKRSLAEWKLRTRTIELGRRTLICGVVNVTPDSFSDGGRFLEPAAAITHALQLLDEGADLLDLGAESTRPGSRVGNSSDAHSAPAVGATEEQTRLLPVLEGILKVRPNAILSVDTYKADTARAALANGAQIINDVSGLNWDQDLAGVCAQTGCGVVLMHTRRRPDEWAAQAQLPPDELLHMIDSGLQASMKKAAVAGIAPESIVLDPGYGFGKRGDENFAILAGQSQLLSLGRPLLAGLSRKSFLGGALKPLYTGHTASVEARETASLAAMVAAILQGASVVRVHNARPAVEAALIADALLEQVPDCK